MTRKTRKQKVASKIRATKAAPTQANSVTHHSTKPVYTPTALELNMLDFTRKDTLRTLLFITALFLAQYIVYLRLDTIRAYFN